MPQVSRKPLDRETANRLFESFFRAIGLLNRQDAEVFLNDLLTRTERVMLAKRLAISILLDAGKTYQHIKELLNVSQSTITAVGKTLELSGGYRRAIEKLKKSERWKEFWQELERFHFQNVNARYTFSEEDEIKRKLGHRKKTLI
ncbi:hypothetical protein A3F02_02435 [Candidatus Curtissbacteria bacterium RIFCSPHIGHO2_12_FULL_38_9b]|uniref:TrpR like protein, YerC/YecD n=1 Tax=Candidatus Curtissbacteria bacterium RIFCSPHIGHO2_12_FULL_38_9b TaxID=1797720 RepID=A0A1F5GUP3_9BACT|nr:MAG: hypothetical protein A3F02_02435 [Candidatus Curtissbacteria bacterium RIFCSPHIGHO2_12_FULL_38_9b]